MKTLSEILKEREKIVDKRIVYLDDNDNIVSKEHATKVIITEYDKDGNVVNEIFGKVNNEKDREEER